MHSGSGQFMTRQAMQLFSDASGPEGAPFEDSPIQRHVARRRGVKNWIDPNAALRVLMIAPAHKPSGQAKILRGANTIPYQGVTKVVEFNASGESDGAPESLPVLLANLTMR